MELIALVTQRLEKNDDLVSALLEAENGVVQPGDILVVSSKAAATAEGRMTELAALTPSDDAKHFANQCGRTPLFCQAVLDEMTTRNGKVIGSCPGALVTELAPDGLPSGSIITANAGMDESNAPEGYAVGWPEDPVESARKIRSALQQEAQEMWEREKGKERQNASRASPFPLSPHPFPLAVIVSDSCVRPRRWGITAFALAAAGMDPLRDEAGREDLFGRTLRITKEAVADQLATAANMLMGNADQCIPAVIIRASGIPMTHFAGWVPGVSREEDLFNGIL